MRMHSLPKGHSLIQWDGHRVLAAFAAFWAFTLPLLGSCAICLVPAWDPKGAGQARSHFQALHVLQFSLSAVVTM